ncbi:MAG: C40 family peptidase [Ignavibacteriales bacterium]|nr:C40 family peptidase [Ignavibacteriales bacterium]
MKKYLVLLAVTFLFVSCSRDPSAETKVEVHPIIKELQQKYAPDKRISIILKGDVDNKEAKEELLAKFREEKKDIIDSVEVLPADNLGIKTWGIVTVSVANMRTDPREGAELGTQALMGSIVKIWKRHRGYVYAQTSDKYLGWADPDQMQLVTERQAEDWNRGKKVFVTAMYDLVRREPDQRSLPVCDITAGGVLKDLGTKNGWTKVELADGQIGFLPASSVIDYAAWGTKIKPTPENVERTGKFLMGAPYLWGGTSIKGVDCSGFTKTVFLLNGVLLNRDANQQADQGVEIEPGKNFENLKKGDLLFFGRKAEEGKQERIVHVGIYLNNREYIHSSGKVQINSFDPESPIFNEYNLKRFVRARRVITASPQVAEVKTN